jgi:hypothetical protein
VIIFEFSSIDIFLVCNVGACGSQLDKITPALTSVHYVIRGVLPAFAVFGFYRWWLAIIELYADEAHPAVPGWSICSMRVPCAGDQRRTGGDMEWLGRDR